MGGNIFITKKYFSKFLTRLKVVVFGINHSHAMMKNDMEFLTLTCTVIV